MNKLIITITTLLILGGSIVAPKAVLADGSTTCTNSYGQAVACPEGNEEIHETIGAGIGDVSLKVVSVGVLLASGFFYVSEKRKDKSYQVR